MLDNFSCIKCRLLTFFNINIFKKFSSRTLSECQTVWIQIRTDILSVLIWIQNVSKGYQQTTIVTTSKKRVNKNSITSGSALFAMVKTNFWDRNTKILGNHNLWPLEIYYGQSKHHCIKLDGIFHLIRKGPQQVSLMMDWLQCQSTHGR